MFMQVIRKESPKLKKSKTLNNKSYDTESKAFSKSTKAHTVYIKIDTKRQCDTYSQS